MRRIVLLTLILVALIQPALAEPKLVVESKTVQSDTSLNITLTEAPTGLAGYNVTISVENPNIAEIESVEFPSWATLHDNSSLPSSTLWIKAVDLNEQIQQNASNIVLATLRLKVKGTGVTQITLTSVRLDDDNGNPIDATVVNGTLEVAAQETTPSSSSGASGGGGGGSSETASEPTQTVTPSSGGSSGGGGGGGGGGSAPIASASETSESKEEIKITAPTEVKANSYFTMYIEVPYNATVRIKLPEGWTATKTEMAVNDENVSTFIGVPRDAEGNYTITVEVVSENWMKTKDVTIRVIKTGLSMPFFYSYTTPTPTPKPTIHPINQATPKPTEQGMISDILSRIFNTILNYFQMLIKSLLRILTPILRMF